MEETENEKTRSELSAVRSVDSAREFELTHPCESSESSEYQRSYDGHPPSGEKKQHDGCEEESELRPNDGRCRCKKGESWTRTRGEQKTERYVDWSKRSVKGVRRSTSSSVVTKATRRERTQNEETRRTKRKSQEVWKRPSSVVHEMELSRA